MENELSGLCLAENNAEHLRINPLLFGGPSNLGRSSPDAPSLAEVPMSCDVGPTLGKSNETEADTTRPLRRASDAKLGSDKGRRSRDMGTRQFRCEL